MGFNKVIISGNLGADPESKTLASGDTVCNFRVATNRRFKTRAGEQKEETEWFSIVTFGPLAELCQQYLSKGRQVLIEGRGQTRKWEDKQTGQPREKFEVLASEVEFIGGRDNSSNNNNSNQDTMPF